MRYLNLDVIVGPGAPGEYPVHVRGPGARSASTTLALDPGAPELREALARIDARDTDAAFLKEFGAGLYARLFHGRAAAVFDACYEEARAQAATGVRLRLCIDPPELAALPWEFLYHARERAFLATLVQCPLVRFLQDERRARSLLASMPLRMLVCIAELPPPHAQLDTARERADLEKALEGLAGDRVQVEFLEGAVTEDALCEALGRDYDCLHFIGHGDFVDGRGRLLLCGESGGVAALDEDGAAALLRNATTLKLAFLNACKGATRSTTDLAAGLGPRLIEAGLPAVVAMQYAVQDRAAVLFAREFYRSLFRGDNRGLVDHAVTHARARLTRHFPADRDVGTPVVFLRAEDGVVFHLEEREPFWRSASLDAVDRVGQVVQALDAEVRSLSEDDPRRADLLAQRETAGSERERLRRAGLSALLGAGIAVLAFWAAALDRLDLGFEQLTGQLGRGLIAAPLDGSLRMVAVTPEYEEAVGAHIGAAWRPLHAQLIERLAAAGARTVAFDMTFHEPVARDRVLADAIHAAARRDPPMGVVIGYAEMLRGVPHLPKTLVQSGVHYAIVCAARAAGESWARSMPLAVRKDDGTVWPGLALESVAVHLGLTLAHGALVAGDGRHVLLQDAAGRRVHPVPYSYEASGSADSQCEAIDDGDRTYELLLTNPALASLRAPERTLDYGAVLEMDLDALARHVGGRLVLVGAAVGRDSARTAAGDRRFGYELHASVINDVLAQRALARAAGPWQLAVLVVMALAGAVAAFAGGAAHPWRRRALLLAVAVVYLLAALGVLAATLRMLDAVYHLGALFTAYAFAARGAALSARSRDETAGDAAVEGAA